MNMAGDNFSIEHPEIHKAVEQLLKDFSFPECKVLAKRLIHRVEWIISYYEENEY
jgi:hypothetical protein